MVSARGPVPTPLATWKPAASIDERTAVELVNVSSSVGPVRWAKSARKLASDHGVVSTCDENGS